MSDKQSQIEQRDSKYWIKPGVPVAHREFPERKMIVDDILKKTEVLIDEKGNKVPKTFTVGIECHWFDKDGRYDRGRFLTMEVIPFGKKQKLNPQKDSFPKEIPSQEVS